MLAFGALFGAGIDTLPDAPVELLPQGEAPTTSLFDNSDKGSGLPHRELKWEIPICIGHRHDICGWRYVMKHIIQIVLLGLLMGLLVMTVGCASAPEALETEPDFTGFITEIHTIDKTGTPGQILVESHADKLVDKYIVTIKEETLILEQDGDSRRQVAFEALETKQQVQVWFSGPVRESFPMQATAQQVVVIR